MTNPGQELRAPADIAEICAGRDAALEHWLAAYDAFHRETFLAAGKAIGRAFLPLAHSNDDRDKVTRAFMARGEIEIRDPVRGNYQKRSARDVFAEEIRINLDRSCWSEMKNLLGFDQLFDRQARAEFEKSIAGRDVPEFSVDNCQATFGHYWENRRDIYLRGIASAFSALDRRFRSHDGFKIGARLIVDRAINLSGWWHDYNRRDTVHDVERIFREIEGKPPFDLSMKTELDRRHHGCLNMRNWGIVQRISAALASGMQTPFVVQGDYFRVRVFGNGNLHLWFENDDLVRKVNLLLAEYYGEVIGDAFTSTEAESAPGYHVTAAKDFGAFMSNEALADRVMNFAEIRKGDRVLEPSAGTGVLAKAARAAGGIVECCEIQPGMAHELRLAGFPVACADFLQSRPEIGEAYDVIVMNPPFDRGRDCDHVRHAWQHLKPGGKLVAIMSARAEYADDARHRAFRKIVDEASPIYGCRKFHDLPERSFAHAGTNINTVVLALRKRSA